MPVTALDADQRFRTFLKQRVGRFQKDRGNTRFYFAPRTATLDPIAKAAGLDPTEIDALATPIISLRLKETPWQWSLGVIRARNRIVYSAPRRGKWQLVAVTCNWMAADRGVAEMVIGSNGQCFGSWVMLSLPTQVSTTLKPRSFLIETFAKAFTHARLWNEVERRYGPRKRLTKNEKDEIEQEQKARRRTIRTYNAYLGLRMTIEEEILRRERRPLVEKWLEEVLQ
jgi:hypothetical protein